MRTCASPQVILMMRLNTEEHNICRTYYKQAEPTEIKDLKHHNIQDLQTRQYTVYTRQYLKTHQLRCYVVLAIYIIIYVLHTQDT